MKKRAISLAIVGAGLVAYAYVEKTPLQVASASADEVTRFLEHPQRCDQLLGNGHGGDVLPPSFHVDLEAALDASPLPAKQAIGQISTRCKQRLSK